MTATRRWTIAIGLAGVGATLVLGLAPVPLAAGSPGEGPADMVFIPGGEFDMGSNEPVFRDAQPVHRVVVDGFWIHETEITNAQFAEFVRATRQDTASGRSASSRESRRFLRH